MSGEALFADWDWEDPDALSVTMEEFTGGLATCQRLEVVPSGLPVSRADFRGLGVSGIEFAAFRTRHPRGLGTDLVGLRDASSATEPGQLYRADGAYFTQLDIAGPLPFGDACVDWAYAEHLVEHVPPRVAIGWLAEVRRVLAPGGLLRLTTPDLAAYARCYVHDDGFFAKHRRRLRSMRVGPPMPERRAFMFNQLFFLYGHRWLYDTEELHYVLSRAGFDIGTARACSFRMGARPDVADLDTTIRNDETIYVEVTA